MGQSGPDFSNKGQGGGNAKKIKGKMRTTHNQS